ncbi:hypothetical protein RDWZM_002458 [Blomia tropicalis]|uniref:Fatty acid-binding protein n=1 Tax=Blomia tropicalis TaxID=40697 RepID=A0A9Q0RPX8_BLOTA|nr:hypothetical protein RDWZM_002458 [Blomia tropicalis]
MVNIFGKYKLATSENFDPFLKEIGVSLVTRKLANAASPSLDVSQDDEGFYVIKATAPFKTQTTKFKLGEEFDEERMDGKKVKSIVTAEGNTYTQIQKDKDLEIKYIREFTGDEIKVTSICNNVSCLRVYKRV